MLVLYYYHTDYYYHININKYSLQVYIYEYTTLKERYGI